MNTIIRNLLSILRRFRMATFLNVTGLAVAFAAFMVIMMQLNYDYNFDRCHEGYERIFRAEIHSQGEIQPIFPRALSNAFIASSPHIEAGALYIPYLGSRQFTAEIDGIRHGYEEKILRATPNISDVFPFDMTEGSVEALNAPGNVLIPKSVASKIFGDHPAIGGLLVFDDETVTVGGVYKDFPRNTLIRNGVYFAIPKEEDVYIWDSDRYELYIKVDRPENSALLVDNFKANFDFTAAGDNSDWISSMDFRLTPLTDVHFVHDTVYDVSPKSSRQMLWVLLTIAFIIVIIAAINYTNFSTALTPLRIKSINTQKVLGGDEPVIRRSLLAEAVGISFLAFLLSLLLVYLSGTTRLVSLMDADPVLANHLPIVLVTAAIALVVGFFAGLYPSYYMTSFPPALVLKGSFGLSPKGRKLRSLLISVQFIASFALIIGSCFMFLQSRYMAETPLGFDKEKLIVSNISRKVSESRETIADQLKSYAGIEDVTFASFLMASQQQYGGWGRDYKGQDIQFQLLTVDYTFPSVMGIRITEGRDFRAEDRLTRRGALIFNEKARVQYDMHSEELVGNIPIAGFVPDVKFATFHTEVVPMAFYVCPDHKLDDPFQYAYIKTKQGTDLRQARAHVEEVLQAVDTDYAFHVHFFDQVLDSSYEKENNLAILITLFSSIAIFISIVGVFGLVVFESEYKRKEIGVRKILGSTTAQILAMFNLRYVRILSACFVLAIPIAWYTVSRWLENFAYRTPIYWWVFLLSFLLITAITIATVTFQSWRVADANPVNSIKTE